MFLLGYVECKYIDFNNKCNFGMIDLELKLNRSICNLIV